MLHVYSKGLQLRVAKYYESKKFSDLLWQSNEIYFSKSLFLDFLRNLSGGAISREVLDEFKDVAIYKVFSKGKISWEMCALYVTIK